MSTATSIPRVSVLMPAYNADATIGAAVRSALAQTIGDIEVIVSDDGSTSPVADALRDVSGDERLRIVRRPRNGGVSAARNSALAVARAPLVAQLDADDLWHPDHLEHLVPCFADAAVGLAYANVDIVGFDRADRWIAERVPGDGLPSWISDRSTHPVNDLSRLYRGNPIPAPAVVMRTSALRAVGGYPEWLGVGEEYYVYIRLRRANWRFAYVDRRSATYNWPEPGRGATFNARRNAREEAKLFAVLAVSSRPNRAIYSRLAWELTDVVKTHVPATVAIGRRAKSATQALRDRGR